MTMMESGNGFGKKKWIRVQGATEHNLKNIDVAIERGAITVITGVSGSGKSSLAFDTVLAEAQRRFFYTLSHYSRQFLDLGNRPSVRHVDGLSPAIALAQNETQPSRRATVGTLTDVSELLGVTFARFAEKFCPKHGLPTSSLSVEAIADGLTNEFDGKTIAICAPIAEKKKGAFAAPLTKFAEKGYLRAIIDGRTVPLNPLPELAKEEKHTIAIMVDLVKVGEKSRARLVRAVGLALQEAEGYGVFYPADPKGLVDVRAPRLFSTREGCPTCGYSWPRIDPRYFSANSLGRCGVCQGYGETGVVEEELAPEDEQAGVGGDQTCRNCHGTGLDPKLESITLGGKSALDLQRMSLRDVLTFVRTQKNGPLKNNPAFVRVAEEIEGSLQRVVEVGLGYLFLARRVRSLSGGEAQRLRLANVLGENLRGVLYVLDEPSQGLHVTELESIWLSLEKLRDAGNTLVIVDHDETFMRKADWIIDLGPGGGADGGFLMAKFAPADAAKHGQQSLTARYLAESHQRAVWTGKPLVSDKKLVVQKPRAFHLKMDHVTFPMGALTVVCGVSGAGKSSLVFSVLAHNIYERFAAPEKKFPWHSCDGIAGWEQLETQWLVDRKPIAKSSVSMPVTYLDVLTELRDLYASLPEAQVAGLTARSFSLWSEGGRCEECKGRGHINLTMKFLADAKVLCPVCEGDRYHANVLEVKFDGLSINDVLNMTIDQALQRFQNFARIVRKLQPASELGLGYLKLGQPTSSLSGGESQRLKLVPLLTKRMNPGTLVIMDEPTTGLHFQDVGRLINQLKNLVGKGATVIVIEHNSDVIRAADWLVEIGPASAAEGGQLLYEGIPQAVLKCRQSVSAPFL